MKTILILLAIIFFILLILKIRDFILMIKKYEFGCRGGNIPPPKKMKKDDVKFVDGKKIGKIIYEKYNW